MPLNYIGYYYTKFSLKHVPKLPPSLYKTIIKS